MNSLHRVKTVTPSTEENYHSVKHLGMSVGGIYPVLGFVEGDMRKVDAMVIDLGENKVQTMCTCYLQPVEFL